MKAFSLWQPWAGFVATGAKKIETRGKGTGYRGPLVIHAAKKWGRALEGVAGNLNADLAIRGERSRMIRLRDKEGDLVVPRGCYVAVVVLEACEIMTLEMIHEAGELERRLGDWQVGRWAWKFSSEVYALKEPIPAQGHQWLWTPSEDEVLSIKGQLGPLEVFE